MKLGEKLIAEFVVTVSMNSGANSTSTPDTLTNTIF